MKQWLRKRIVSALSYDPNSGDKDPSKACAVVAGAGCIDKASDCYLLFRSYFELGELGKEWRKTRRRRARPSRRCTFTGAPTTTTPRARPGPLTRLRAIPQTASRRRTSSSWLFSESHRVNSIFPRLSPQPRGNPRRSIANHVGIFWRKKSEECVRCALNFPS